MAKCQEANNVIRRKAILDIATFTEQNMHLKPMTAILNIRSTEIYKERKNIKHKKRFGQAKAEHIV